MRIAECGHEVEPALMRIFNPKSEIRNPRSKIEGVSIMDMSELGIQKDGTHRLELTDLESRCMRVLKGRGKGLAAAISAEELTWALGLDFDDYGAAGAPEDGKRKVRKLVNHLIISHSKPIICRAGKGGGYFLAGSPGEVEEFHTTFHKRSMTGLIKASRGKKAAFVEIVGQLSLSFDDPETRVAIEALQLTPDADPTPAWVDLTTRFLDRISNDPEKYSAQIRAIQEKYGDIFVPRETVRELKAKTSEFQQLLSRIAA